MALLGSLPAYGLALLDAAIKRAKEIFDSATYDLTQALGSDLDREARASPKR